MNPSPERLDPLITKQTIRYVSFMVHLISNQKEVQENHNSFLFIDSLRPINFMREHATTTITFFSSTKKYF